MRPQITRIPGDGASTALLTDQYEYTMLSAALASGYADRMCSFEVFARRLPGGRRYGVVAGTGRILDAIARFRFGQEELRIVAEFLDAETVEWLRNYRFTGDIDGYREGELYFPGSPVLTVRGTFAECVVLETLVLSILNHDSAIASAAARMVASAKSRPIIEMGSRRTHEEAAVAASRAAYLAGFTATSNLEAVRRHGVPGAGTSAHAFTLLHTTADGPDERSAFAAQIRALGVATTLLVDTYDITQGVANAIEVAGPSSAVCASTPATSACSRARSATNWTPWERRRPGSSSQATSTSTPLPRCGPSRSTPTASERLW